jgi:hypothetical protein
MNIPVRVSFDTTSSSINEFPRFPPYQLDLSSFLVDVSDARPGDVLYSNKITQSHVDLAASREKRLAEVERKRTKFNEILQPTAATTSTNASTTSLSNLNYKDIQEFEDQTAPPDPWFYHITNA